jgi:exosome complex component RRP40
LLFDGHFCFYFLISSTGIIRCAAMEVIESLVDALVLPGDTVGSIPETAGQVRLGPGLSIHSSLPDTVVATQCGVLRRISDTKFYVESNARRYVPHVHDLVLGVVTERYAEQYIVDLGSAHLATLSAVAFDGASRRNRPNLNAGTLVYARVSAAHKDMDPEIVCTTPAHQTEVARDWVTGESLFGELRGGMMVPISLGLARNLLRRRAPILAALGDHFSYECAVGVNGQLWVAAASVPDTIKVVNAIQASEFLHDDECRALVNSLLSVKV